MPETSRRFATSPPDRDRRPDNHNIEDVYNMGRSVPAVTGLSKSQQNFKCPKFSGNTKDWKIWNKGFVRYLSIWDLEHVLDPSFFDEFPLSAQKVNDNKLVFYILEDATQSSPLAASIFGKLLLKMALRHTILCTTVLFSLHPPHQQYC